LSYFVVMGREGVEITGMVRKVDGLGRVVLPIELRRTMGIDEKDPMKIFVNGEQIIFKEVRSGLCLLR